MTSSESITLVLKSSFWENCIRLLVSRLLQSESAYKFLVKLILEKLQFSRLFVEKWLMIKVAISYHRPAKCKFSYETSFSTTAFISLLHGAWINFFFRKPFLFFPFKFFYLSTHFLFLFTLESYVIFQLVSKFLAVSCSFSDALNLVYCEQATVHMY